MPHFLMPSSKDSPQSGALTAEDIIALRLGFKIPHEFQVGPLCFTPSVQRNSSQTTEARKKLRSLVHSGTIVWREINWSQWSFSVSIFFWSVKKGELAELVVTFAQTTSWLPNTFVARWGNVGTLPTGLLQTQRIRRAQFWTEASY